jgi:peroxiredoxin
MKRFWIFVSIAGAALIAVSAYQYLTRPSAGDLAPGFKLPTIDGTQVSSTEFSGRPMLIHFWATWCGPCRVEFPSLARLHKRFSDTDFAIIAISEDGDGAPSAVRAFLSVNPVGFPVLIDEVGAMADEYMAWGVPESLLIDRSGKIVWRGSGAIDWDAPQAVTAVKALVDGKVPQEVQE